MQNRFSKPYPMSRISYPTSDAELETWVEQTIQREIARGRFLQDQKAIAAERSNNVEVFINSPKLAHGGNCRRRTISKWNKRGRSRSPLRKNGRMSSSSQDNSCSSYRPRSRPACSMRISELAAPTKRQCMASWRANANILPETMINRLKQRVTDQEPIVKVSDAVNCLKHNRRSSDASSNVIITQSKRPSRKINKEAMQNKIKAEYKAISEAFGIKIAELLFKPIIITLNSRLQNISDVVSEEIYNIIKDTKTSKTDRAIDKRMVKEISEKVTIWIAQILEDAENKLLEEDLRARALLPAGDMVTLIEIITYQERDLEEQEGPVLDILDDLVDSILHKCIKTPSDILTPEFISVTSEDIGKDDQPETDRQTADDKANDDTIENDIVKQIKNVIDSITQENVIDSLESPSKVSDIRSMNNGEKYVPENKPEPDTQTDTYINSEFDVESQSDMKLESDTKLEPDVDVLYSNDTPIAMPEDDNYDEHNEIANENTSVSPKLSSTQLEISEPPVVDTIETENKNDEILEQNSKVSGAVEVITEELSDGKNKTVQFSKENLESINDMLKDQHSQLNRKNVQLDDEQLLENIAYFDKHIDFAPPNEELLSDADESWPDTLPLTKPSASVTRSITSMGRILEADEMFSTAFDDGTEYLRNNIDSEKPNEVGNDEMNLQSTSQNVEGNMGDLQSSKESFHVDEKGDQPDELLAKPEVNNLSEISLIASKQKTSATSLKKNASIILICDEDVQASELYDRIALESDMSKFNQSQSPQHLEKDKTDNDVNTRELDKELISHKFDYRVHLKDAPAWIRRGQGEPNIGSCVCMPLNYSGYGTIDKMKQREIEYRKWCQDLDFILMNLDKWNSWLNYISKYITDLKRKAGKINRGRLRSPTRTAEDISWRQLHKRATGLEVRRQDQTVKLKIPSAPLKYCLNCGRRKPNPNKKRHHQSSLRNNAESKCKRHHRRENAPYINKN